MLAVFVANKVIRQDAPHSRPRALNIIIMVAARKAPARGDMARIRTTSARNNRGVTAYRNNDVVAAAGIAT